MEQLVDMDSEIFFLINQKLAFPLLDKAMLLFSNPVFWAFFWGVIFIYAAASRNWRLVEFCLLTAIAISITDAISFQFLKPLVGRYRPCYQFVESVRLVAESCGGNLSFPSNHAGNAMTFAVTHLLFFGFKKTSALVLAVPLLVGISRVYLGVHFPGDVLGGYLVGGVVGLFSFYAFSLSIHFLSMKISKIRTK